ncbi:MAG: (d)CMP kinase [Bacillota bacterium]|nr:(d)CMP kinase [Bacillota bacterium]
MIIAIDGPSGAGKSTVAKLISKTLNFEYIDTGAMYRALAYKAFKNSINICKENEDNINEMLKNTSVDYDNNCIYLDGENVNDKIRDEIISKMSSKISTIAYVRLKMVDLQRAIAKNKDVVMDGRDIGTAVFPNANYKFFITATVEKRAKRRYNELIKKGMDVCFDDVLSDIIKRDNNDTTREISPLQIADDAILIDTTEKDINDVVKEILNHVLNGGKNVL